MKTRWLHALCGVAILSLTGSGLAAPEVEKTPPVQTRLKRVALFKNGLAFFVREGALSRESTAVLLGPFAAPSHGTFWVSAPGTAGLRSLVAREVVVPEKVAARDVAELLRANVGREVTIFLSAEPESALRGVIRTFAPDRSRGGPEPWAMGLQARADEMMPIGRGQYVMIETAHGAIALDPYRVHHVLFDDAGIAEAFVVDKPGVELEAAFTSPQQGDWLSVSYLAKGLTWAPSYLIDVSDPKKARLTAKALIVNEAEDMEGVHVELITGFPNLTFADRISPIARKQDLASFLQSLTDRGRERAARGVVTQNTAMYSMAEMGAGGAPPFPDYGAAEAGRVAEDLFLYPLEQVTLARNETGYYPLFTEVVPYQEFYSWDIPDYINPQSRYVGPGQSGEEVVEEVWHSLRLTNDTKVPWTTAPAQLMKEGQIIGQDTLGYTPPKAKGTVRITQAVSVKAEQAEVEVKREREAVRMYGDYFDRVTIEGTLNVRNYQEKLVRLEITKALSGEVKRASHAAQDTVLARGLRSMNPSHSLKWEIDLLPGEEKEITYVYEALIRR